MKKGFYPTILLMVFAVIFIAAGGKIFSSKNQVLQNTNQNTNTDNELKSCGTKNVFFNTSPLNPADIRGIVPLGNLAPTAHVFPTPHLYFHLRKSDTKNEESIPAEVPVFAPADMTVKKIKGIEVINKPEYADYNGYYLAMYPCKEFKLYFDHLKTLSPQLKEAYKNGALDPDERCTEYSKFYKKEGELKYKLCSKIVNVPVKAGQKIGTAGGAFGHRAFDVGAADKRIRPHAFANPSRWEKFSDIPNIVCALDYFAEDIKNNLKAKLGDSIGAEKRTKKPVCGEVAQDIANTAQGVWFLKGTKDLSHERGLPEDYHLSLVWDNIQTGKQVFAVGLSMQKSGLKFGNYFFVPKNSGTVNRDFKDVKADGKIYCFETADSFGKRNPFVIALQMTSSTFIKIEKKNTQDCSGLLEFSNVSVEFER